MTNPVTDERGVTVRDPSETLEQEAPRPAPVGNMRGGRATIVLPGSSRLILAEGDSAGYRFKYIIPSESPNTTCPRMAFRRDGTEEPLSVTGVVIEEQGSSSVLVVEGVATPAALAFAGVETAAVDLMACDRAIALSPRARSWIRHFLEASERR
jgi:hypothetical protein